MSPATAGRPVSPSSAGRPLASVPTVVTASGPPRLRRSAIPEHEPRPATRVVVRSERSHLPHVQGTLALVLPDDEPEADRSDPGVRLKDVGNGLLLPDPRLWAAAFAQAAMEVTVGLRSPGQLVRWTTPDVHAILARRGALAIRAQRTVTQVSAKPRLRAMNTCLPRPGVCEVGAVIAESDRIRAVAFRMEGMHDRWRVTELEIG